MVDHFHRPVDGCIPGHKNHSENLQATLQPTYISKALQKIIGRSWDHNQVIALIDIKANNFVVLRELESESRRQIPFY